MLSLTAIILLVLLYSTCESNSLTSEGFLNSTKPYLILITSSGKETLVHNRTANLQSEDYFDATDSIREAHIYGLWLFYADKNYNWIDDASTSTTGNVEWVYNTNPSKIHKFGADIESFRPAGDPDDFRASTFNLFLGLNFTGPDDSTQVTEPYNIPFARAKSLIITGSEPWFLYTSANFVQRSLCVHPSEDSQIALISDYYLKPFTRILRHISSATRNGCTNSTETRHLYYETTNQ